MDDEQFAAMYAELYPVVLGYLTRRTDWHVAEDVASQALTVAWHRADAVPTDPDARRAWLIVVARNLLANSQRSRLRAARLDLRIRAALAAGVPTVELDPADVVADRLLASAAMRRLSPRDQEVLQLVAWEGLDIAGLASVLGCSPTAASTRLHRARHRIEVLMRSGRPEHEADDAAAVVPGTRTGEHATDDEPQGPFTASEDR
ncbi:RNA polymerase sigma factor [Cellulomonas sp. P22]|uniref:RNA polymerase sigma factor n=1 Tax=Cellulomonas sp. P22 TaxID=3373189 RepID=UPI0037AF9EA6